jgi:fucose 4-O-acetylase-like acetyltransferase
MNQRVQHIDVAKGIAIALVALYHASIGLYVPWLTSSAGLFQVPLFFLLSGVFVSFSGSFGAFAWKKFDGLLKPYFFTLFGVLTVAFIAGSNNTLNEFLGVLYGNNTTIRWQAMWFLTHLFLIFNVVYLIYRLAHFGSYPRYVKIPALVLSYFFGAYFIGAFEVVNVTVGSGRAPVNGLPFNFDILLVSTVYFIAGIELKKSILNLVFKPFFFTVAAAIFVAIVVATNVFLDLAARAITEPLLAAICSVLGIYSVLVISSVVDKSGWFKKPLLMLGKGSIFILIFHSTINYNIFTRLIKISDNPAWGLIAALIAYGFCLSIPLVIQAIVQRVSVLSLFYYPFSENPLVKKYWPKHSG